MDVSSLGYCRSCRPSLWNFATNLCKSQMICVCEKWWLRLSIHPPLISHHCYIYIRCLTTFICCGCAYGCIITTLWPFMPTKLVEFCHKSGQVSDDMWPWKVVIEAVDPSTTHLTSLLCIYKVFDNLYLLWMCIWMCPHHITAAHVDQILWNFATNLGKSQMICDGKKGDWGCRPNHHSSHITVMYI
jgi:hypothetical protein